MKIVTIIENDVITGVRYGVVEIPDIEISPRDRAMQHYARIQKLRAGYIQRAVTKQRTKSK